TDRIVCRPERLARAAGPLREDEGLVARRGAEGEDLQDGAARTAREGRVANDRGRAAFFLAGAGDPPLRGVDAGLRILHGQRSAKDRLFGSEGQARRARDPRGPRTGPRAVLP